MSFGRLYLNDYVHKFFRNRVCLRASTKCVTSVTTAATMTTATTLAAPTKLKIRLVQLPPSLIAAIGHARKKQPNEPATTAVVEHAQTDTTYKKSREKQKAKQRKRKFDCVLDVKSLEKAYRRGCRKMRKKESSANVDAAANGLVQLSESNTPEASPEKSTSAGGKKNLDKDCCTKSSPPRRASNNNMLHRSNNFLTIDYEFSGSETVLKKRGEIRRKLFGSRRSRRQRQRQSAPVQKAECRTIRKAKTNTRTLIEQPSFQKAAPAKKRFLQQAYSPNAK